MVRKIGCGYGLELWILQIWSKTYSGNPVIRIRSVLLLVLAPVIIVFEVDYV